MRRQADHPTVDLDAYFARIGYRGAARADLATLQDLIEHHVAAIVFEAIDVMLDRGVDLAPAAIDDKLIARGRGGYCFEQNGLFRRVLKALGFEAEGLIARVMWMSPPDAPPGPWSHMVLRVTMDGVPYLADVGFGTCVPTSPLRFDDTGPQQTAQEAFRLTPTELGHLLEVRLGEEWARVYEVSRHPCSDAGYQEANLATSTHPGSHFRNRLMVARTTPQGRIVLVGNRLTMRGPDGGADRQFLSADELEGALRHLFHLPVEASWRPLVEAAADAGQEQELARLPDEG